MARFGHHERTPKTTRAIRVVVVEHVVAGTVTAIAPPSHSFEFEYEYEYEYEFEYQPCHCHMNKGVSE
jgi:hypothetical protein